ncbi:DUF317 domain-containing protein [Streptacidiphilus jiangxiensis]|uniref:DUF317 domain-containing protein n=1 Tax=Streptacidiphilus jiangxiensis TaxID=235985 RepID=A0A1H8A737_STRJI|nr:DUF317 domain-containing protein [Streptacidiphilus jiangxiensis]SEM66296.1 protein of unknown function [Streptacidiphilus jiangxiensis]
MTFPADDFLEMLVSPVYLAGSTGIGDPGLRPILDLDPVRDRDDLGNLRLRTRCGRVRVGFEPEQDWDTLWKIAVHRAGEVASPFDPPVWCANFSEDTPTEIVTAVTRTLADAIRTLPEDAELDADTLDEATYGDDGPLDVLWDHGWKAALSGGEWNAVSRDGHAIMSWQRRPIEAELAEQAGQDGRWYLGAGGQHLGWYGRFSSRTPLTVVTAATRTMTSPDPVRRWSGELSTLAHLHATVTRVPTPADLARPRPRPTAPLPRTASPVAGSRLAWTSTTPSPAPGRGRGR